MSIGKTVFVALAALGLLAGCESEDDNKIEQARACLDKNPGAAAQQCETLLNGVNGPEADALKVRIRFEWKGLIRGVAEQIKNGLDDTLAALIDTDPNNPVDSALQTLNQAIASGNTGLKVVARLSYVATLCKSTGEGGGGTTAVVKDGCLDIAAGSEGTPLKNELAAQAVALKDDVCSSPSDRTSTDQNNLCKKLTDALALNPSDPAAALAAYVNNGG